MASFLRLVALLVVFGAVFAVPVRCAQTALAVEPLPSHDVVLVTDTQPSAETTAVSSAADELDVQSEGLGDRPSSDDPRGCASDDPPRVSDLPTSFESKPTLPGVLLQPAGIQFELHPATSFSDVAPPLIPTTTSPEAPPPRS
jgi:hypothetical protein